MRFWHPCLHDRSRESTVDEHYFYQAAWMMGKMVKAGPRRHVDIGSDVKLVGMLTAIADIDFVDIRPFQPQLSRFNAIEGSILDLPFEDASVASLSSLHVIEHIGLGRYGDPVDAAGSEKAVRELIRVLKPGGRLYLSAPIGRERVCFNAHRVFDSQGLVDRFAALRLVSFAFVNDAGDWEEDSSPDRAAGSHYACGMYVFEKAEGEGD